jgi:transcriptional regulator with XRE-family HTH domain
MKITPEHISSASGKQLSRLFGTSENTISTWTQGYSEVSGRVLSRAAAIGIPKEVLMSGLDLRRQKAEESLRKRQEFEECLSTLVTEVA